MGKTITIITEGVQGRRILTGALLSALPAGIDVQEDDIQFSWPDAYLRLSNLNGANIDCDLGGLREMSSFETFEVTILTASNYETLKLALLALPSEFPFKVDAGAHRMLSRIEALGFVEAEGYPEFLWSEDGWLLR